MEEEVKAVRTIKEFISWYESSSYQFVLSPRDAEVLRKFYEKFKFTCVSVRKKFYNMGEDALLLKLNL